MSPMLSAAVAAIGRSVAAGGAEVEVRFTPELERELLDLCEDHDNSERDSLGVHVIWDDDAGWRVRVVGCRGSIKSSLTRVDRAALMMADAAMPFIADYARALERANNLASGLDYSPDVEADIEEALRAGMRDFGLVCGDVEACARCMGRAWRRSTAGTAVAA